MNKSLIPRRIWTFYFIQIFELTREKPNSAPAEPKIKEKSGLNPAIQCENTKLALKSNNF